MSISDLLEERRPMRHNIFGVMVGIVTNNQDPENLGRVKLKIPRLSGEDESNWARVATFMAGKERGAFYLPEVDDEVLIVFECGDIDRPYVIGSLWNGKDLPPVNNSDGENNLRVIKSRSGHLISLNDKEGDAKIEIIDQSGKNAILIETKNNKITIKSDQDIELAAPNGKVTINGKEIEIKSSAGMKLDAGANLDQNASGNMTLKGSMVDIN
ncbi:MAG TPA: phage baseplate assembly protein V [Bacillota bacterium]|nr:phage baseplate assembly protein V [Bacillota bacterium]